MLTFDPGPHEYRWNGVKVPSVTACLDKLHSFAGVPIAILDAAKERGTYVHQLCEAYDLGDLDESRVPDEYLGYLNAWKKFVDDYRPNWRGIEVQSYSKRFGFAGTEDRHGTLSRIQPGQWDLDLKTGILHPVMGLQLAAYRQLRMEVDPTAALSRRATVHLRSNGTYKFQPWNEPTDWTTFCALLQLIDWSHRNV